MTYAEYECLNHIRYAMKMHLRWEYWDTTTGHMSGDGCYNRVLDAMEYLVDKLWEEWRNGMGIVSLPACPHTMEGDCR